MMAMDHALTEAMREIEELDRHYEEQERVIKDRHDLIAELMAEEDSDDDSDSDSALTMREMTTEELRMTLRRSREGFRGRCPSGAVAS
jgi:hypothetical protein